MSISLDDQQVKIQKRFVNKNQWHSCGDHSVDDFLLGKNKYTISVYEKFVEALRSIGEFTVSPAMTRIAFITRMRFVAINRIGRNFINVHLILSKRHESSIF